MDTAHAPSLEEIHSSVPIPRRGWKRFLAFSGPAFLVSVGYMDPGNWGTDIEAGSQFGYRLLWVLLMSNLMAVLLQSLATRLGIVTGRDLAQACRDSYPRPAVFLLWILCEIAIGACDLAEVIGTIIGLKLLFHVPYLVGLAIAAADTFLLLALQRFGVRLVELVTLGLIGIIAGSFFIEIWLASPVWSEVVRGLMPGLDTSSPENLRHSLFVAIGMLGATVMPHNLYLHSALVQSRAFPRTEAGKQLACRYNFYDSVLALNGAFFVNAAILVLSVSTFYLHERAAETLQEAHELLGQVWGTSVASVLFAVALLASGQSSTMTGTLAGQVVMEGFIRIRVRPWARRLLTRSLAIVPALLVLGLAGSGFLGGAAQIDHLLLELLVLSQVVLCFQLPFAIVPLVQCTSNREFMGSFTNRGLLKGLAWLCAGVVTALDGVFVYFQIREWAGDLAAAGWQPLWIYGSMLPLAGLLALFLGWITLYPLRERRETVPWTAAPPLPAVHYRRIGVGVELEGADDGVLAQAVALARAHGASLVAIHAVEGPAANFLREAADDREARSDRVRMAGLVAHLREAGLDADGVLGFGNPVDELVRIVQQRAIDLLVLGAHGHRLLADLALGSTVSPVLHRLSIPVLVVPAKSSILSEPRPSGSGKAFPAS
jgi:manganese transport protein